MALRGFGVKPYHVSFCGSPPHPSFEEIAGFETSSRQRLLKDDAPCHPDAIVQSSFANKKFCEYIYTFS